MIYHVEQPEWYPEFTHYALEHCEGFNGPCENVNAHWCASRTFYQDERANWHYLCDKCEEEMKDYWNEMWETAVGGI